MSDTCPLSYDEAEVEEWLKKWPIQEKPPENPRDVRVKQAAAMILRKWAGITSQIFANDPIIRDAASLLIDDCLLLFREDLFEETFDTEPGGFIKLSPDFVDFEHKGRLLRHGVTPKEWLSSLTLPSVWRKRLSPQGIEYLQEMVIYRKLLNEPIAQSPQSATDVIVELSENSGSDHGDDPVIDAVKKLPNSNENSSSLRKTHQEFNENDPERAANILQYMTSICDLERVPRNSGSEVMNMIDHDYGYPDSSGKLPAVDQIRFEAVNPDLIPKPHHPSIPISMPTMRWDRLRNRINGLTNNGNTCYINAAIQCLASTPPLADWLLSQTSRLTTCQLTGIGEFCSVCELVQVVGSIHPSSNNFFDSNERPVASAEAISAYVTNLSSSFAPFEQEDTSLFIVSLLNHCISCLTPHLPNSSTVSRVQTVIDQIFSISLLSTVQCSVCSTTSTREEVQYMLSVEINRIHSLQSALFHFVDREILTGMDAFHCLNCQNLVQAEKRLTIDNMPLIIMINLKRSAAYGHATRKLTHEVQYDELIDLAPYLSSEQINANKENQGGESVQLMYRLYSVLAHKGDDLQRGHCYSYIRTANETWLLADDAHSRAATIDEVLDNQHAFVLFYAKAFPSSISNAIPTHGQPLQMYSAGQLNRQASPIRNNFSDIRNPTIRREPILKPNKQVSVNVTPFLNRRTTASKSSFSNDDPSYVRKDANGDHRFPPSRVSSSTRTTKSSIRFVTSTPKNPTVCSTESSITINHSGGLSASDGRRWMEESVTVSSAVSTSARVCGNLSQETSMEMSQDFGHAGGSWKELASVASGAAIAEVFESETPSSHHFRLNPTDLCKMAQYRKENWDRKESRLMESLGLVTPSQRRNGGDPSEQPSALTRKVNVDYLNVLHPYLKKYNAACGLCVCTRYFAKYKSNEAGLLLRCVLKCGGRVCKFRCKVYVLNNGHCFAISVHRKILHLAKERVSRYCRGSRRQSIIDKFRNGASVHRMHTQLSQQRTAKEKSGFNYDATGKSKKVLKKIKAEMVAESLLSPDVQLGILQLHDYLADNINGNGIIKGALQKVQFRPFCVVAFTEATIRLYDAIVSSPNTVLSWDATGGVVQRAPSNSKQCLYYELTLTHPNVVNEDSLIPLTFMLSESQSLSTVIQWLMTFKDAHKKVFPHKKDNFPRPMVVLSDRAQVFLQGALHVFNNENHDQFLARAYRIVTNKAIQGDLSKTNIHACLSHFMLDMRKCVNRFLPEDLRELGMWSMALLVNTRMWTDMQENWRLICHVFWNYVGTDEVSTKRYSAVLLSRIKEITNDPNSSAAITNSETASTTAYNPYDFEDDSSHGEDGDDCQQSGNHTTDGTSTAAKRRAARRVPCPNRRRKVIDEEQQLNEADSPFKRALQLIFNECSQHFYGNNRIPLSTDKRARGIKDWISFINRNCIPTIPVWSNLLLGNLSRHGLTAIRAFNGVLLSTHDQRTNAISERRMAIVKRTQLGTHTLVRADLVLQILVQDMQKLVENFSVALFATPIEENNSTHGQQLREVHEHWRKSDRRGCGHYANKPERSVVASLKSALISPAIMINRGVCFPELSVPNWLNLSIQLLLSIETVRCSIRSSSETTRLKRLHQDIVNFIVNWQVESALDKRTKKTSTNRNQLLSMQFDIPTNVPAAALGQSAYLLNNVLLPIVGAPIAAAKTYKCTTCAFTVRTRFFINHIPINVIEGQLSIRHELDIFFTGSTSDMICPRCSLPMTRQVHLIDCPSVIILTVNRIQTTTFVSRKPPKILCFQRFLDRLSIGCPSSSLFDLVSFSSVVQTATNDRLVAVCRIKQRWRLSSTKKLIGEGEQLCQLLARSCIIVLERVRSSNTNFVRAIAQCCSIPNEIEDDFCTDSKTLRDAVKQIENDPALKNIYQMLISKITTHHRCQKCFCSPDSLSSSQEQIFLYDQPTAESPTIAVPLSWDEESLEFQCSVCNEQTDNVILLPQKQTHQSCPSILMYHQLRTTIATLPGLHIELIDSNTQSKIEYRPISVLLVDQYDGIAVIKLGISNELLVYCNSPYTTPKSLSDIEINDLFETVSTTIIFLKRSHSSLPDHSIVDANTTNNERISPIHTAACVQREEEHFSPMEDNIVNTHEQLSDVPAIESGVITDKFNDTHTTASNIEQTTNNQLLTSDQMSAQGTLATPMTLPRIILLPQIVPQMVQLRSMLPSRASTPMLFRQPIIIRLVGTNNQIIAPSPRPASTFRAIRPAPPRSLPS